MSGVIPSNLKEKRRLYLKPFTRGPQTRHTDTHTHRHRHTHTNTHTHTYTHIHTHTNTHRYTHTQTHDDSIRRNAMRCISPKNLYIGLQLSKRILELFIVIQQVPHGLEKIFDSAEISIPYILYMGMLLRTTF